MAQDRDSKPFQELDRLQPKLPILISRRRIILLMTQPLNRLSVPLLSLCTCFAVVGCKPSEVAPLKHEPNYLYAHALGTAEDTVLDQPLSDTQELLTEWFGTLDEPKLPPLFSEDDYQELLSIDKLKVAAGPPATTPEPGERGLYRQLCASCHGETGQGRGPVAASQNPYPREFRHGVFKYKSTPRRFKPVKADIAKLLRNGLAGSQMPLFNKLPTEKLEALVDYVVFLSIRGELERKLLYKAAYDLDLEKERIYNASFRGSNDDDKKKALESQLESATEILTEIADLWNASQDKVEHFPLPAFPLLGNETDENREALQASIAKGKELFASETAACAKCHGASAKGDGTQLPDYDDWTKDWTSKIGIKPTDIDALLPLMARGGMKPQPLKPRNIVEGKFRGGREPIDIYRRIRYGIVGAPMPAATIVESTEEKGLVEDDVWHLVNYVLSIAEPPAEEIK
jgi:mono/diheme cytochrome c family protein